MGSHHGKFGRFGGRFVPETLMPPLIELENAYHTMKSDRSPWSELEHYLRHYCGRPTPLYRAERLSREYGVTIYLKREDLNPTGAHKITNCIGQALLARRMGKKRLLAETGAGQHGVAVATAAAMFEFRCTIYMGARDVQRQEYNVRRMERLGAEVVPVHGGSQTLKDATNEALRDWAATFADSHYLLGSAVGPHPFPTIVRDLQSVIGREARRQIRRQAGRLPDRLVACVGGGSNSIGLFHPFLRDRAVQLVGVEAGGDGAESDRHARSLGRGRPGVFHGALTYVLQDDDGQIRETHSVSAGLDYSAVGPELSWLAENGRLTVAAAEDGDALAAFHDLIRLEGLFPALESAHALGWVRKQRFSDNPEILLLNLSGRGDKDLPRQEVQA